MKTYFFDVKIEGRGFIVVSAKNEEEAILKAKNGDWEESELNHWDVDEVDFDSILEDN